MSSILKQRKLLSRDGKLLEHLISSLYNLMRHEKLSACYFECWKLINYFDSSETMT